MDKVDFEFQVLPELTPQEQKQIEHQNINRLTKFYESTRQYSLESWYAPLADFTFKSHKFPLTNIEAYLLTVIYQQDEAVLQRNQLEAARISLIDKVNKFLKEHFPMGCFMKLSTRSPKDAGWRYQDDSVIKLHIERITNLLAGTKQLGRKTVNKIYRYFLQESKDKLKVCSAQDFIDIFAHSERIQIDLNDLAYLNSRAFLKISQGDFSTAHERLVDVWGRQWVSCEWMEELRCFFYDYQLTAICQYDQRCFFEQLKQQQQSIAKRVVDFFQNIRSKLKQIEMSKGVMDLIVKFDLNTPVILIEINIFDHNSRASLFSWQKDIEILQHGPLELRILQEQIEISKYQLVKMMGMVQKGIQNVLVQVMKRLNLQAQWANLP